MVKVKVCGVTRLEDALEAVRLGADLLGFNQYPLSPRYLEPSRVASIRAHLPSNVLAVGLFVDGAREHIERVSRHCGFDVLQFHGDQDDQFLRGWREKVIKVVRMRSPASRVEVERTFGNADWCLVDALTEGYGGGGRRFPLEWLEGIAGERLFLAGGLDPQNVSEAVRFVRPYGVDVATGIEVSPGVKDWKKLEKFIENAKSA